jgi:hypothetical protein
MGLIDSKRAQRLYDQVAGNRKNCAYEDLERLLEAVGFAKRSPRSGSSHVTFKRGTVTLTVPRRKPLKEHYVDESPPVDRRGDPLRSE